MPFKPFRGVAHSEMEKVCIGCDEVPMMSCQPETQRTTTAKRCSIGVACILRRQRPGVLPLHRGAEQEA